MTQQIVVRSSSVEAAKAIVARNTARGRPTDEATMRLAQARVIRRPRGRSDDSSVAN